MHYKQAIETFEPTPMPHLVHDADAVAARAKELTVDLRTVTGDIRTLRQLLESTLNEAQLEVFRDIEAKQMLRDRLATDLDLQMRSMVRRLHGGSRG